MTLISMKKFPAEIFAVPARSWFVGASSQDLIKLVLLKAGAKSFVSKADYDYARSIREYSERLYRENFFN